MRQELFSILALTVPFAACFMFSASSNESTLVKYLNQTPEQGSSISIAYVMIQSLPKHMNMLSIFRINSILPYKTHIESRHIQHTLAKYATKQPVPQRL